MIDGEKVIIGGKEYIFADLNFKAVKKVFPYIQLLNDPSNAGYMDAVSKIVTIGLQRNYPDITEDFIDENLELAEMPDLMEIITKQLTKKKNQAIPAQVTNPSIGENSILGSLPPQDGPGNT
jgi:hypothetical protein